MAHVLVINRWTGEIADYERYLDHRAHRVSYLTSDFGEPAVVELAQRYGCVSRIVDVTDELAVLDAARWLHTTVAPIDGVVALSEMDQLSAARVRELLGLPGPLPAEMLMVRDKHRMKRCVAAAGIPTARHVRCDDAAALDELVATCGFPLVVKPRDGFQGRGVHIVRSADALMRELESADLHGSICEQFLVGDLYHCDGLVERGALRFWRLCRYVNTPLDYLRGEPLGSVVVDDPALLECAERFVNTVIGALPIDGAFHLELFVMPDGRLIFSEIGGRPGGGPVNATIRHAYGVDLMARHAAAQAGLTEGIAGGTDAQADGLIAGYLCIPEPASRPCRVTAVTHLADRIPELYREIVPAIGAVLDGRGNYLSVAAHFFYEGSTTAHVMSAIRATMRDFRLDCERTNEALAVHSGAFGFDSR